MGEFSSYLPSVITVCLNIAVMGYFVGTLKSDLRNLKDCYDKLCKQLDDGKADHDKLIKLEGEFENLKGTVDSNKGRLENILLQISAMARGDGFKPVMLTSGHD